MAIDSPEEAATKTLDQIKNQITLGELEVKRLRGLKAGEEYALAELVKSKEDHQASIVSAQQQLDSHNADIKKLQKEIDTLTNMLRSGEDQAAKYRQQKTKALKVMEESETTLRANEDALVKIQAKMAEIKVDTERRQQTIIQREEVFESNLSKLKDIIDTLEKV